MLLASFRVFRRFHRLHFRLQTDDGEFSLRSPFLLVGNNCYDGNILAQSLREHLDEGRIWIYTTRARRHFAFLRMVWQALRRRELTSADALDAYSTTQATVHLRTPSTDVAVDGEIHSLETPLRFRTRPRSLHVLLPRANASAIRSA